MVDFPDGIVVSDDIDEDLIHPGFLQFLGRLFPDETGMADHLKFGIFSLDRLDRRDESLQWDLAIPVGSAAHQNTEGAFGVESVDDPGGRSQGLLQGSSIREVSPCSGRSRRSQWVPVTLMAANLSV